MTLVSTYNPESQTICPKCQKPVNCTNIGGITFGSDPYLDFHHAECGTEWRYHIHTGEIECPIPKPMTLREMMGEENWHAQKVKERAQSFALEMLETLEAILSGDNDGLERAKQVVAKAKLTTADIS